MIHDQKTGNQKVIEITKPWKCAASPYWIAVTTLYHGLHLYTTDGILVRIVPDSTDVSCVAFHPHNTNILAIGYGDGTVRICDGLTSRHESAFKQHLFIITNIRFASDRCLLLSSHNSIASIINLDDQFQLVSLIIYEGHLCWIKDILPFPFSQCLTCSSDETIQVWDCGTGACLGTLNEHTNWVTSLAMHPIRKQFASGSYDKSVIIWSSETFEVLRRIRFPEEVQSIAFGKSDTLYAGIFHNVMSCNALTGEVGLVLIPGTGYCESLFPS